MTLLKRGSANLIRVGLELLEETTEEENLKTLLSKLHATAESSASLSARIKECRDENERANKLGELGSHNLRDTLKPPAIKGQRRSTGFCRIQRGP